MSFSKASEYLLPSAHPSLRMTGRPLDWVPSRLLVDELYRSRSWLFSNESALALQAILRSL
jgi:hypothetical protein